MTDYAGNPFPWPDFYSIPRTSSLDDGLERWAEYALTDLGDEEGGSLTHDGATGRVARAHIGALVPSFASDLFGHILIVPARLALGNIVTEQSRQVEVANLYLDDVDWESLTNEAGAGIAFVDLPDFPVSLQPFGNYVFGVTVDTAGPPTINGTLEFGFDVGALSIPVSGNRIIAWPFLPEWSNGVRERLAWATDILTSETLAEQRRAVRRTPRRRFTVDFVIEQRERTHFDLAVTNWGARVWAIPIWPDVQMLATSLNEGAESIPCDTTHRDFREGGLVFLRGSTPMRYEVAEIASLEDDEIHLSGPLAKAWTRGTRIYPARPARLVEQPRPKRFTDQAIGVSAQFLVSEASHWPVADLPEYRDYGLFIDRPNEDQDLESTFARMVESLDTVSALPSVYDGADVGLPIQGHRFFIAGASAHTAFRSLLYTLRGRQVPVWVPSHYDDLRLVATAGAAATSITVENVGYAQHALTQPSRRDIRIELFGGAVFNRRIVGAQELDEDTEQLDIDSALGQEVTPADVARISFLMLARSDEDEIEILHETDIEGIAKASMRFRGVRDDEL